jgi:hypothetical protein
MIGTNATANNSKPMESILEEDEDQIEKQAGSTLDQAEIFIKDF